ncbi:MAG: hypothetical protein ABSG25_01855 [Bryobacteraceae bacterium]
MGNPAEEKRIFTAFLNDCPLFAGGPVTNWTQPQSDPPDIECDLQDGRTIGLELTNWLNERQIANAKEQESMEEPFRRALRGVPNETQHFQLVWMNVKERLRKGDEAALQDEMTRLMIYVDKKWETELDWQSPQGFVWNDFADYPTLARYFVNLDIHPRRAPRLATEPPTLGWLTFPCRGGSYSPDWAVDALCANINTKIAKYSAKPTGLAAFFLLVHYDVKAYAYNSPVEGIGFSYPEAVAEASRRLGGATGVFDGIFVYVDTTDGQKSFTV